ncbi:MAG: right-handed parallel beta-helix repeat-containing protein [Phycisphaeraceae bacterium]
MRPTRFLTRAAFLALGLVLTAPATAQPGTFPADDVPRGEVELAGQDWQIAPEPVRVASDEAETVELEFGETRASHLRFLHTFKPGEALAEYRAKVALAHRKVDLPPEYPTVLRYRVSYEDGETLTIPVRFGEGIEEWYRVHGVGPMLWAKAVWQKDLAPHSGEMAVLYAMTWPNPRPDRKIRSIEALGGPETHQHYGDALVLAVAGDDREATGRYLYVDHKPVGSDANPGTFDKPFGTLHEAVAAAKAGDTVFIRGGRYYLDEPVEITAAGEEGKWLTITAWPGETPIIDGWGVYYRPEGNRRGADTSSGLIAASGQPRYLRIQGLQVQRSPRAGISVYGSNQGRGQFVEINHNTTWRTFTMGIISHWVDDITVNGNRVIRPHSMTAVTNRETGELENHEHMIQEGIDLSRNDGFEIAWNEVYGGGKEAIDCISIQNGTIHHNYVHSSLNGIYIDSWSVPIVNLDIHHNFIHNAYAGVPLATEGSNALEQIDIHHNIIINTKSDGIGVTEATYKADPSPVHDIRVFRNTVDHIGYHAQAVDWNSAGIRVAGFEDNPDFHSVDVLHNIVTDSAQVPMHNVYADATEAHDIRVTHNLLYPAEDQTLDRFRGGRLTMTLGEDPITKAPQYVAPERGDYRLEAGSPAIDAGLKGEAWQDPDGSRADLGALPYGSAWRSGFDWAGRVTAFYRGDLAWTPVHVPLDRYTVHRNHLQRPSWFQINRYGADFQNLPEGEQSFGGITWFIETEDGTHPTVLVLEGRGSESRAKRIDGIPVGRKADALAFLHSFHRGPGLRELSAEEQKGLQLFHYQVNYADGSTAEVPVVWKEHVDHWLDFSLTDLPGAELAWNMHVQRKRHEDQELRLYALKWANPRPEVEIESIDIVRDGKESLGGAAVFAISTGETID